MLLLEDSVRENSLRKIHNISYEKQEIWIIVQNTVQKIQEKAYENPRKTEHSAKDSTQKSVELIWKS